MVGGSAQHAPSSRRLCSSAFFFSSALRRSSTTLRLRSTHASASSSAGSSSARVLVLRSFSSTARRSRALTEETGAEGTGVLGQRTLLHGCVERDRPGRRRAGRVRTRQHELRAALRPLWRRPPPACVCGPHSPVRRQGRNALVSLRVLALRTARALMGALISRSRAAFALLFQRRGLLRFKRVRWIRARR